jgi:flagellar hook-associated protein 1 FlgK
MVNINSSLYNTVDSMRISQAGLSVVSNNIANMNTEGYSKQRLDLEAVTYKQSSIAQNGAFVQGGVAISQVTRYQDEFLNGYIMQENGSLGYYSQMSSSMSSMESYFNEVDGSGLTGAMQDYFTAAQNLANDPTSKVNRSNFVTQAQLVAKQFNQKATNLENFRENLVGDGVGQTSLDSSQIGNLVNTINSQLSQVAELNGQISSFMNQGGSPNELLDKRQLILDQLSKEIPISAKYEGNSCEIYVGGVQLLNNSSQVAEFKATVGDSSNPAKISIVDPKNSAHVYVADYAKSDNFTASQGSLKAMLDLGGNGTGSIYQVQQNLDSLAQQFATSVNDIQLKSEAGPPAKASLKMNPTSGQLEIATENIFLNDPDKTNYDATKITAANLCVNQAVISNPYEVATAYAEVSGTTVVNASAVGNNNNAQSFLNMRQQGIPALQGLTVEGKLYSIASEVGNNSSIAKSQSETQQTSVQQLTDKKSSQVGVSLDEELVDLMKYQKAYQASAQVFSVINQMMQVINSMVGS